MPTAKIIAIQPNVWDAISKGKLCFYPFHNSNCLQTLDKIIFRKLDELGGYAQGSEGKFSTLDIPVTLGYMMNSGIMGIDKDYTVFGFDIDKTGLMRQF